jgi:hypothetical protein
MSHGDDEDGPEGDVDAQLRSLRAVWLAMPDENPPERGLDALMAAARTKAVEMAEASTEMPKQPSWWERFVATLRRPQVLALATVLLLVAGVLVIGDRSMKASAPANHAQPSPENVPTEHRERESLKVNAPPPAVLEDTNAPGGPVGGHVATPQRAPERASDESVRKEGATNGEDALATGQWQAVPMDPTAEEVAKNKLLDEAKTAAAKGDCNSARTVARQLEKQDLGYYRSRVVPDPGISDCLQGRATGEAGASDRATSTVPAN